MSNAEPPKTESAQAAPPKPRSRTSTSYVPWAELMRRTLGINPLVCPVCSATMVLLAVITQKETIRRILTHVKLPRAAVANDETALLYFDVTGEPVPDWARGVDPEPAERGPPEDCDVVDPPAPCLHTPSEAGSHRQMGASWVPWVGAQEGFAGWMRLRGLLASATTACTIAGAKR